MISRGIIIGRIIDDLSILSEKIEFRAKLGMYDIHRVLENFVRDVLRVVYDSKDIINLNSTRTNAPGLDLGSNLLKTGFQVSSRVDSRKINDSFAKLSSEYIEKFQRIKFIVIGEKNKSYPSYDATKLPSTILFDLKRDIIDFKDLSKLVFDLTIEKLIELNSIFDKEFLLVKYNLYEPEPHVITSKSLFRINHFLPANNGLLLFNKGIEDEDLISINREGNLLSNLPLRTRHILEYIIKNGKNYYVNAKDDAFNCRYYLIPKLQREINLPDNEILEELNILIDEKFLGIEQRELHSDLNVPETAVFTTFSELFQDIITYAIENHILNRIVAELDLTIIDNKV